MMASATKEVVLGFDARNTTQRVLDSWDSERRNSYLYRVDAPKPLSADNMVWPSIVPLDTALETDAGPLAAHGLWADERALADWATSVSRYSPSDYCVVAVTLCRASRWNRGFTQPVLATPTEGVIGDICEVERVVDNKWRRLGFDVGDSWMLSGLSNCGLEQGDDFEAIRGKWGSALNQFHLFESVEIAAEFAEFADVQVPKHAPFAVYGLWLVDGVLP